MNKQDFLFELGCEELPPKALPKLAQALHDSIADAFNSLGLQFSASEQFATPRRLAVRFTAVDEAQADKQVEKLGPAVAAAFDAEGNPRPAATGFATANGVTIDELSRKQTDKGERLAYIAQVKGLPTEQLLADIINKAIAQLPVPKAMRWGESNCQFSRPVHWVLALFGAQVLPLELFDVTADRLTYGHRFHAPKALSVKTAADYDSQLREAKVIASFSERQTSIQNQVEAIAKNINAKAVIDSDLLAEVAALVEWPVALIGSFDESFLTVPAEALISSMAEHQKYFHLLDTNGKLLAKFIAIANIESSRPQSVIEGNEKVIRPRLADAKFFFDTDRKQPLANRIEPLKSIVFQDKLGTLFDKSQRLVTLSKAIAHLLGEDDAQVGRAATLCKCDLMTDMVYEFPDLQGIMGRYYAMHDGETTEVAAAMDEVYMPRFAGDQLPQSTTGTILAIAERIDTLVGIFGIGQIPTGAKDPFALRRAALGVLRLISENQLDLDLVELINASLKTFDGVELAAETETQLLEFFAGRSTALYQAKDIPTQVIQSIQALNISRPTDFENRLFAVNKFSQSSESADLAEANKRVKNILEKSEFDISQVNINPELFEADENALFSTINDVKEFVQTEVSQGRYQQALDKLAGLKSVVNKFFDNVMINVDDPAIRNNRLALITELRQLFLGIADISLLQK